MKDDDIHNCCIVAFCSELHGGHPIQPHIIQHRVAICIIVITLTTYIMIINAAKSSFGNAAQYLPQAL